MPEDALAALDGLVRAAMNQKDIQSMMGSSISRLAQMDAPGAASVISALDSDCISSADRASLFLTLLDFPALQSRLSTGSLEPQALRSAMIPEDPHMAEAWARLEALQPGGRIYAMAKVSLLLEVYFLLNRELKDASLEPEHPSGAAIALRVLADLKPGGPDLSLETTAFAQSSQRLLSEVLEELDFIQRERGSWSYRLDDTSSTRLSQARNLLSYRSASATLSPLALTRAAENMVKRLGFIVRATGMYPSGHPAIAPSVEGFLEVLASFFSTGPMVTLSAIGGELMVNDLQVRRKGGSVDTLLKDMSDRGVSSITFQSDTDAENVMRFSNVFNKAPVYIKEHGGLASLLERREVSSITVDQYRYALVSKDGTVMGGTASPPEDTTLENIIFTELVDRLERGDTIRDLPDEELGMAFKKVIQESMSGVDKQRGLLASFVAALDPGILEKGILARRDIQKEIAWSALRKIIRLRLGELDSTDEDVRLEATDRLLDLVITGIERNKDNTVVQIIDMISRRLPIETSPDTLYTSIILIGAACEALISRGRFSTAELAAESLEKTRTLDLTMPELVSARRRALAEALRRIDTPEVGEKLVDSLLSYNEIVARQGETLAGKLVLRNMTTKLLDVFNEPDRHQRARAFRVLKKIGARVAPVLIGRLRRLQMAYETPREPESQRLMDEDWFVARNVIQILGELRLPESVETLRRLTGDPDERIREVALIAYYSADRVDAAVRAREMLRDASSQVASVAIELLGAELQRYPELTQDLKGAFNARPGLRRTVFSAFRKTPGIAPVRAFLVQGFQDPEGMPFGDADLAEAALEILREGGRPEDGAALRAFLKTAAAKGLTRKRGAFRATLSALDTLARELEARAADASERPSSAQL